MEVVLKQDVDKLGLRGEVVNVARGYARNFLLPRGLAEVATPGLLRELEKRDAQRARHEAKSVDEARAIAHAARGARAALRRQRRPDRLPLRLGDRDERRRPALGAREAPRRPPEARRWTAIKRIGRYTVPFEVFPDVVAELRLVVAPEGQELPPEEELAALEAEEAAANAPAAEAAPEAAATAEAGPGRDRGDRRRGRGRARRRDRRRARRAGAAGRRRDPRRRRRVSGQRSPQALHGPGEELSTALSTGRPQLWISAGSCRKDRPFRPLPQGEHTFYTPCIARLARHRRAAFPHPFARGARGLDYGPDGHRPGTRDCPGPAAEPRRGRVRARGHDALSPGDRGSHRVDEPQRRGLLPREPRPHLQGDPRPLREGRARRRDHGRRRARPDAGARGRGRPGARARARDARPGRLERPALRAHRQRDGHAARADPRGQRHRPARLRPPRRHGRARRPCGVDRLQPLAVARLERVRAHRRAAQGLVRDDHEALRGGQRHHRDAGRASATSTGSRPASSRAT